MPGDLYRSARHDTGLLKAFLEQAFRPGFAIGRGGSGLEEAPDRQERRCRHDGDAGARLPLFFRRTA
jgi:hypothetical protein